MVPLVSRAPDYNILTLHSLAQMHTAHSSVLEPRHTAIVEAHLEAVHRSGRRSRVMEVGAVSVCVLLVIAMTRPS